ncbi:MAG TPA: hypothetical protein VL098_06070 [Flavipsychrobacter sp.]|nr:hypothetical protein [Flavipsychrobacter sp.]
MKKLLFSLALVAGGAVLLPSCKKIIDEIKKNINPFEHTVDLTYTIPTLMQGQTYNADEQTYILNVNDVINDNTEGLDVDIDDISSIKINKIVLTLENADAENNWTNLQTATAGVNSDKGRTAGKADIESTITVPDAEAERYTDKTFTFADHNLKDYLNGGDTKIYYSISAKARRAVTKELTIKAKIEYSFKP